MFRVFSHHPTTHALCGITTPSDYITASIFARHMRRLGYLTDIVPENRKVSAMCDGLSVGLDGTAQCVPGQPVRTDVNIPAPDACEGR